MQAQGRALSVTSYLDRLWRTVSRLIICELQFTKRDYIP